MLSTRKVSVRGMLLVVIIVFVTVSGSRGIAAPAAASQFHRFWPDNLYAIDFISDKTGFIAGYSGTVLRTDDGGATWNAYYIGQDELIRRVSFIDERRGWAVGHRGSIFHTSDGARTWSIQYQQANTYLRDIEFVDQYHGWAVGHNASILRTEDGGNSWKPQVLSGFNGRDLPRIHGIAATNSRSAVLVGEFGVVALTRDGGVNWWVAESPIESSLLDVAKVGGRDDHEFLAVGLDGTVVAISEASPEQRDVIRTTRLRDQQAIWKKAKRKAKRRGHSFEEPEPTQVKLQSTELFLQTVDAKTSQHLLAITTDSHGAAYAVGRAVFLKIKEKKIEPVLPVEGVPFAYMWLGGVAVQPDGAVWAVGIRGSVMKTVTGLSQFAPSFQLGSSDNVNLVSSRWQLGQLR